MPSFVVGRLNFLRQGSVLSGSSGQFFFWKSGWKK